MLQFLKKVKLYTKLVPETVHQVKPNYFFWSTGRTAKKVGSIGWQNKNNII